MDKATEEKIKEIEEKIEEIGNKAVKSREHICYMDCIDAYGIDQAHKEECFDKCYGKFIKKRKGNRNSLNTKISLWWPRHAAKKF